MKNADMPANSSNATPQDFYGHRNITSNWLREHNSGLTKREYAAIAAMQNVLVRYDPYEYGEFDSSDYEFVAKSAVGLADKLFEELDK